MVKVHIKTYKDKTKHMKDLGLKNPKSLSNLFSKVDLGRKRFRPDLKGNRGRKGGPFSQEEVGQELQLRDTLSRDRYRKEIFSPPHLLLIQISFPLQIGLVATTLKRVLIGFFFINSYFKSVRTTFEV